jgi:uncharacterized protein (DUF2235 family)
MDSRLTFSSDTPSLAHSAPEQDLELQNHHSEKCLCKNDISDNRRRRLVVAFDGTENKFGPQVREDLTRSSLRCGS